jgi:hypothetical protein
LPEWQDLGEVQQRAGDGGGRDAVVDRDVARVEAAHQVQVDAGLAALGAAGDDDVDLGAGAVEDPPPVGGAPVAQDAFVVGECRGHQATLGRDGFVAQEVDAAITAMKATRGHPVADRPRRQPGRHQLLLRDRSSLGRCDLRDYLVTWSI